MVEPLSHCRNRKRPSSRLNSTPANSQVCYPLPMHNPKASMTSTLTKVRVELDVGDEADLEAIAKIYQRLWMECQRCYIFKMDEKHEVDIQPARLCSYRLYDSSIQRKEDGKDAELLYQHARQDCKADTMCHVPGK